MTLCIHGREFGNCLPCELARGHRWLLGEDERGWYAHQPSGPSWVRIIEGAVIVNTHDGGCTIPDDVLEALRAVARVSGLGKVTRETTELKRT